MGAGHKKMIKRGKMMQKAKNKVAVAVLLMLLMVAFDCNHSSVQWIQKNIVNTVVYAETFQTVGNYEAFEINFKSGKAKLENEDYLGAITDLTSAIGCGTRNQDVALAYLVRGAAYAHVGDYKLAILDYSRVINIRPNSPEAYTNRGLAYQKTGNPELAIVDLNKAVALAPNIYVVYTNRGATYGELGEYEKAIDDFNYAITLKGNYCYEAYLGRALAYSCSGKYNLALSDLDLIIDNNLNDFDARYLRGGVYVIKGDYNRGISALSGVIKYSKDNKPALFLRGMTYIVVGNYESAVDDFAELVSQHTIIGDAPINSCLKPIFDWYMPKVLNEQLAKTNSNAEIIFIKGLVENMRDEKEKSLADFNDAVKMKPSLAKKLPWWIRRELAN